MKTGNVTIGGVLGAINFGIFEQHLTPGFDMVRDKKGNIKAGPLNSTANCVEATIENSAIHIDKPDR